MWFERYKAAGARQIKLYSSVKPEIVKAVAKDAHARGLTVTGHIPEGMTAIDGVNDGMDQINHISYMLPYFSHSQMGPDGKPDRTKPPILDLDGPRVKDLIAALKSHHTILDPTVALYETFMHTKQLDQLEPGVDHVPAQMRDALDSPPTPADRIALVSARWQVMMATLRALHAANIPIVAGTDQAIPGYSLHRELELYVEPDSHPWKRSRLRRLNRHAHFTSSRNQAPSKQASAATSSCSTPILWRTFTTLAEYGAPLQLARSMILRHSGAV